MSIRLAPRRSRREAEVAAIEGGCGDALASAGVYVVRVGFDGVDDPEGVLGPWLGADAPHSLREGLGRFDREARRALIRSLAEARRRGASTLELQTPARAATRRVYRVRVRYERSAGFPAWVAVFIDVSHEHESIERLKAEEDNLRHIVEFNPQLPWIADAQGQIIDFTDRWLRSTGMTRQEASGNGWLGTTHPDDVERVTGTIMRCHETGEPFDVTVRLLVDGEFRWMRARAYPRYGEDGTICRWYGYTEDVHEKVLIDQQIRWDAEHDALTGLHNRSYFSTALSSALSAATANFRKVGLLLVDLDNFKDVNDLLGHGAGDELLKSFSQFIASLVPKKSLVARLGGDEFAIMLDNIEDVSEAIAIAERIVGAEGELAYSGRSLAYRSSVGVGLFPDHAINANQLLRHTDLALYSAKARGRAQLQVFEKVMLEEMHERLAMVNRARTAARDNRILAYYQPKVCLKTGELAGFEALLRWQDNLGNIHSPASIYAAFDEKGVADLLGKAMVEHVLSDIGTWKTEKLDFRHVAINASPAEMRQTIFVDNLIEALDRYGIANDEIEIEITEGVFLGANADASRSSILRMSERGIRLALDDFGTGYASLSHLRNLPISTLKIDRSFVSGVSNSKSDLAIVAAIVSMGQAMGMRVVAEGIETSAQETMLKGLSCEFGQGFYYGKPVPSREVPELIRTWEGITAQRIRNGQAAQPRVRKAS